MKIYKLLILLFAIGFFVSCDVDEILNPNAPTIESFESGATLADLKLLSQGLEATIRNDMEFHFWTTSIVGREYLDLRGTDPRYTSELLGQNGGDLDDNGFITTRAFASKYRSVANAELLKRAVDNTAATLSAAEANSFYGFANTIIGYELLLEAVRQHDNGIKLSNEGDFTSSFQESLTGILGILDEGYNQLTSASDDFLFNISADGFSSINSPGGGAASETAQVAMFNRGIAARAQIYAGNKSGALTALNNSYMDMAGDFNMGGYYSFGGATGNDQENPLFFTRNAELYTAHTSWIDDATPGDTRLGKALLFDDPDIVLPVVLDGLEGSYQVALYPSGTTPAIMQRNEELILIYAEANIGSDNAEAVNAINVVRNAAGIGDYTGGTDDASLVDELLYQRRYSLFGEGHRWNDARRYGRLGDIPIDRAGDKVHENFPRPATEN